LPLTTVLLADLPRMLEDMIASVLQPHPDIRIIRGAAPDRDLIAGATAAGAHAVVVTRRDPADLSDIDPRLARAARISIVAVAPDGASACVHTLRAEAARLDDVSAAEILRALAVSPAKDADPRGDEEPRAKSSTQPGRR
jgi:hypothetical protein